MGSPLTDFGQQNLSRLLRLRLWMVTGALALTLFLQFLFPN